MPFGSAFCSSLKAYTPTIALVVSALALVLGCFNFYWIFLKDRKVLHLVYVDTIADLAQPEFAVTNGGKEDLLITKLECSFGNIKANGSSFTPAQRLEYIDRSSFLIPSGKGFHFKVIFTEPFVTSFTSSGKLETINNKQFQMHDLYIDISWVEMDGRTHDKSVQVVKYGFNAMGEIGTVLPLKVSIDLYK